MHREQIELLLDILFGERIKSNPKNSRGVHDSWGALWALPKYGPDGANLEIATHRAHTLASRKLSQGSASNGNAMVISSDTLSGCAL